MRKKTGLAKKGNLGRVLGLVLALALSVPLTAFPFGLVSGHAAEAATSGPPAPAASKVFLGYWAKWGDSSRPDSSLADNLKRIDLFSPYWYTLRSDGTLSSRESGHAALTAMVHKAGQKVIPLINKSSSDTPLLDGAVRQKAVDNIYGMLVDNGFDGVNIDFEGMDASTRWGVTAFMRELADKLRPAGLLVTMAVPAKWSADDSINSFAACFDFAALGETVDYLVVMTYDQHAGWSGPGPVAGADWTDKVIRYAVTVVSPGKILLGLAGYGYDWSSAGGTSEVDAWSAPTEAATAGSEIQWDDTAQVPYFTYWTSSGTRHDVWYENSSSIDFKIDQVNRYGLGGVALWALGQEDSRFWQVIAGTAGRSGGLGASGTPGSVAPGTPGGDSGNSGGAGGLGSGAGAGDSGPGSPGQLFADVPASYWAYAAVTRLAVAQIVGGVNQTHFQPDRTVTRAEFAVMLARAFALPPPTTSEPAFRDVAATDWFYDAVVRAVASGYMVGLGQGVFGPDLHLTRQEAAAIAARVGANLPIQFSQAGRTYTDSASIASWAYAAVMEATYKGLLGGFPDGTFRPSKDLTRAEAAVLIGRVKP